MYLVFMQILSKLSIRTSDSRSFTARESMCFGEPQIGNSSATYAHFSIKFFDSIRHIPLRKNVEVGE